MPYTERRGDGEYPWRVRWLIPGETTAAGKPKYDSASGFADEDTARDYGLDMESDIRRGKYRGRRDDMTFERWALGVWFPAYSRKRRPTTIAARRNDLINHLAPGFGHLPLGDINWWAVTQWADAQTCAKSSTAMRVSLLGQILTAAVDASKLESNPVAGRRLYGASRRRIADKAFPEPWQVRQIAERFTEYGALYAQHDGRPVRSYAISTRYAQMYRVLVYALGWTGMRSGEAHALTRERCGLWRRDIVDGQPWRRRVLVVDPDEGSLTRYYDPAQRKNVPSLGKPKSQAGAREIDLPPFLCDMFDEHLDGWEHERLFCEPDGTAFKRNTFARYLRIVSDGRAGRPARAGWPAVPEWAPIVPGLTPHGFRHGHYTWLREEGAPDVMVDDRIGHEGRGMGGVYAHPTPAMRKRVVDALQRRYEDAVGPGDALRDSA